MFLKKLNSDVCFKRKENLVNFVTDNKDHKQKQKTTETKSKK